MMGNSKPLWVAVAVLGAAVLAMGGTMLYQGNRSSSASQAPQAAQLSSTAVTPELLKPLGAASASGYGATAGSGSPSAMDDGVEKPRPQAVLPEPAPAKKVVKPKPQPMPSSMPNVVGAGPAPGPIPAPVGAPVASVMTAPAPAIVAPVCSNCGAVESVTPFERTTKADGPGVGAVAGGVAGAVLGSQVGQGNGRTAAAILGAIGGGFAGNAIEKNMKKETVYRVSVRMDDGSRRAIEVVQAPPVGGKVSVETTGIRSAEGVVYRNVAAVQQRTNAPAPVYQTP